MTFNERLQRAFQALKLRTDLPGQVKAGIEWARVQENCFPYFCGMNAAGETAWELWCPYLYGGESQHYICDQQGRAVYCDREEYLRRREEFRHWNPQPNLFAVERSEWAVGA